MNRNESYQKANKMPPPLSPHPKVTFFKTRFKTRSQEHNLRNRATDKVQIFSLKPRYFSRKIGLFIRSGVRRCSTLEYLFGWRIWTDKEQVLGLHRDFLASVTSEVCLLWLFVTAPARFLFIVCENTLYKWLPNTLTTTMRLREKELDLVQVLKT